MPKEEIKENICPGSSIVHDFDCDHSPCLCPLTERIYRAFTQVRMDVEVLKPGDVYADNAEYILHAVRIEIIRAELKELDKLRNDDRFKILNEERASVGLLYFDKRVMYLKTELEKLGFNEEKNP